MLQMFPGVCLGLKFSSPKSVLFREVADSVAAGDRRAVVLGSPPASGRLS